jgi:hypothetical protein
VPERGRKKRGKEILLRTRLPIPPFGASTFAEATADRTTDKTED